MHAALSTFWFVYLGATGIFFPFLALYLRENAGLTGVEAGLVLAMIPLVSLFAPALWGRIADRASARSRILALVAGGTALGHLLLGAASGLPALLVAMALLSVFGTAVVPLGVSVSLSALGTEGHERFGTVRVWGTVGYLMLVVAFPWILDGWQWARGFSPEPSGPSEPGLGFLFVAAATLSALAGLAALRIPESQDPPARPANSDWRTLLGHRPFRRMLAFGFLAYLCLQGPMNFFPSFVRALGGDLDTVSRMWVVMLLPEIPLIALSGMGVRRLGARGLLAIGILAGGFRWLVCGFGPSLPILYALQLLHGTLIAGLMVGGPLYIDAVVPPRLRSTAQGLLAMAGPGIGGVVSSVVTGWAIDRFGVEAPYLLGGIGAIVLAASTRVLLPLPSRYREA